MKIFAPVFIFFLTHVAFGQNNSEIDTSDVYIIVDTMPTMADGSDISTGVRLFIQKKFRYPDSLTCGLISTIYFEFTISYNGNVVNPNVFFPGNYPDCTNDYEKLRRMGLDVLNDLPTFKPGKHNGKYVNVKFMFPLRILLQ